MDAYSGYNQIKMHLPNGDKTTFITDRGIYCYKVMPFRLKNAGAIFQRMVNKIFEEQIRRTMKVYVDDMLVKSLWSVDHLQHLREAFDRLRWDKVRLNLEKSTFRVVSHKFLGYLVTQRDIEANPNQISAMLSMRSPTCVKEVKMLNGGLATLNRFLS